MVGGMGCSGYMRCPAELNYVNKVQADKEYSHDLVPFVSSRLPGLAKAASFLTKLSRLQILISSFDLLISQGLHRIDT